MKSQFQVLSIILIFFLIYSAINSYLEILLTIKKFVEKNDLLKDIIILYNLKEIYENNYYYEKDFVYAIPVKVYYFTNGSYFVVEINQTIGSYTLFCNMTYLDCEESDRKLKIGFNTTLDYIYFFLGPTQSKRVGSSRGSYVIGIFPYSLITNNETFYSPIITSIFTDYIITSFYKDFLASDKEERVLMTS